MIQKTLISVGLFALFAPVANASTVTIAGTVSVINGHHDITEHRSGGLNALGYITNVFSHQPRGWTAAIGAGDVIVVEQQGVDGSNTAQVQDFLTGGGRVIMLGDNSSLTTNFYNGIFGTSISFGAPTDPTTWSQTSAVVDTTFADDAAILDFASSVFPTSSTLAAGSTVFYEGDTGAQVFRSTYGAGDVFYIGWDYCCGGTRETYADYYQVLESAIAFDRVAAVPLPASLPLLLAGLGSLGLVRRLKCRKA
ncbi:MAG: VPLPA-CTERM sorting domain-containing protein [Sulfitobacter sp.]